MLCIRVTWIKEFEQQYLVVVFSLACFKHLGHGEGKLHTSR